MPVKHFLFLCGFCLLTVASLPAADVLDVTYAELKIQPEDFKNKHVSYEASFGGMVPNMPPYVAESGFDSDKYNLLTVGSVHLPVMAKKSDALGEVLIQLKKGDVVRVTGRVREFRVTPGRARYSPYYLELDELVFVRKAKAGEAQDLDENSEKDPGERIDKEPGRKIRSKQ